MKVFRLKPIQVERKRLLFSIRTTLVSLVALTIGFYLKLESPVWAAITVWVVTQPSRGMTLSKAFYRFLGTAVGAFFAIFLIKYLSHSPWMFVTLLALWVGLSTAVANVVQYFRSYGAMLAGFTAALVGLSVFSHPDQAVEVAGSRVFGVFLGVFVTLIVTSLLVQSSSKKDLFSALDEIFKDTLRWSADVFLRKPRAQLIEGERNLIARISQVEEMTNYASLESMQVRKQKRHLHNYLAALFATISAVRAVGLHWRKNPDLQNATIDLREKTAGEISALIEKPDANHKFVFPDLPTQPIEYKVLSDRLINFSNVFANMVDQYLAVGRKSLLGSAKTLSFHRDVRHAQVVGLRSILAVMSVGAVWLITGFKLGPTMLILTAVNCGIFATSNNPKSGILTAFRASLVAIVGAFICLQLLAVGPQSLWFVFLLLALFLVPGGLFVTHPTRSLAGTLFCANFLVFFAPTWPMQTFHFEHFVELGIAYFGSMTINFAFFYLVLPTDPSRRSRNVIRDIVRDLERMSRAANDIRAFEWETLMYNRVSNLIKILAETGEVKHGVLEGSFAALDIGQEVLRLQGRLKSGKLSTPQPQIIQNSLLSLSTLTLDPVMTANQLRQLAQELAITAPELFHAIKDVGDLLEIHADFFKVRKK